MELIPMAELQLYNSNSRETINEDSIKELAASIEEVGLINPLTVIPDEDFYSIIAGQRRFLALQQLDAVDVKCNIREGLTEEEILEIQITENLQREDIHPMEEVAAVTILLKTMKIAEIADKLGKPLIHLNRLMQLTKLINPLKKLFKDGAFTLAHAFVFCRFDKVTQTQALVMFDEVDGKSFLDMTPRALRNSIIDSSSLFEQATFDMTDKSLGLDKLGSCIGCKFNTTEAESLFGDEKGRCTNGECFEHKIAVDLENKIVSAAVDYPNLVAYTFGYDNGAKEFKGLKIVSYENYFTVPDGDIMPTDVPAIVIDAGYYHKIAVGTIVTIRKNPKEGAVDYSNETEIEGKLRKIDVRHERELRKQRIVARRNIFNDIIENTADLTHLPQIRNKLMASICQEGDQSIIRELYGLGEDRIYAPEFVDKMIKEGHTLETEEALKSFISTVFLTAILGSKYQYDSLHKNTELIQVCEAMGLDSKQTIAMTMDSLKADHKEQVKALKTEVRMFNKVEDMLAAKVINETPVELVKGVTFTYGDDLLSLEEKTLRQVARKFKVKLSKIDTILEMIEKINERFIYLKDR